MSLAPALRKPMLAAVCGLLLAAGAGRAGEAPDKAPAPAPAAPAAAASRPATTTPPAAASRPATTTPPAAPKALGLAPGWSTFLGADSGASILAIAADGDGNIYATGPAGPGFPASPNIYQHAYSGGAANNFLAKVSPKGRIVWATLFGGKGAGDCSAGAVALDPQGCIYIGGRANPGLPATPGAFQTNFQATGANGADPGASNAFVAKFAPNGQFLMWAAYVGSAEDLRDVKVDGQGNLYVAGYQRDGSPPPPAEWFAAGFQKSPPAGRNEFVIKISSDGSKVLAGTYLAGKSETNASAAGLAVNANGELYFACATASPSMPVTAGAYRAKCAAGSHFYLAKLSPDLSKLLYGTYLGGAGDESAAPHMVTVDSQGNALVALATTSADLQVSPGAWQPKRETAGKDSSIYVARLSADGSKLLGATYLGGPAGSSRPEALACDAQDDVYLAFTTSSKGLPVTPDAPQPKYPGGNAAVWFAKLSPDFTTLLCASWLGGGLDDHARCALVDATGSVYVAGDTRSPDFPVRAAMQPAFGGERDAFLAKFLPALAPAVKLAVNPGSANAPATIALSADPLPGGAIAHVTFYANNELIGVSAVAPYAFTWEDVPAGCYTLTAVADGDLGASSPSNSVQVVVAGRRASAPVIVSPAFSDRNPIHSPPAGPTESRLSVLANDAAGEPKLTCTWETTTQPPGAPDPTFSVNGTNAARTTTATYSAAGIYSFQVTVKNEAGLTAIGPLSVKVTPLCRSIAISPANPAVNCNGRLQLSAKAADQFGQPLAVQPAFCWTVTGGGTITDTGLFTAGAEAATPTVRAVADYPGNLSAAAAQVAVSAASTLNQPPTVAAKPEATISKLPNEYDLKVLGASGRGEDKLTYTWAASGPLPAPVLFAASNGTRAGKACAVRFAAAGTYTLTAIITEPVGLAVTDTVTVRIEPIVAAVFVLPAAATLETDGQRQFSAVAKDQFGNVFMPAVAWSLDQGSLGAVSANGLYTGPGVAALAAGATPLKVKVQAAFGGVTGAADTTVKPSKKAAKPK